MDKNMAGKCATNFSGIVGGRNKIYGRKATEREEEETDAESEVDSDDEAVSKQKKGGQSKPTKQHNYSEQSNQYTKQQLQVPHRQGAISVACSFTPYHHPRQVTGGGGHGYYGSGGGSQSHMTGGGRGSHAYHDQHHSHGGGYMPMGGAAAASYGHYGHYDAVKYAPGYKYGAGNIAMLGGCAQGN